MPETKDKIQVYIDYSSRNSGYYYGTLQPNKTIKWNKKFDYDLERVKREVYDLYPDAIIHIKP